MVSSPDNGGTLSDQCSDQCSVIANFQEVVTSRKLRRYVLDGKLYTFPEWRACCEEPEAEARWKAAPHFLTVREFCELFSLRIVPMRHDRGNGSCSCALVGLWFPTHLLLLDLHHLTGKLKGSRLQPQGWHAEIWDDTFEIGATDKRMMVIDFCNELFSSGDPLGRLGQTDMHRGLDEFSDIMDGDITDLGIMTRNEFMRFLSVDTSMPSLPSLPS